MTELGLFKDWLQEHLPGLKEACPARKQELNALYSRVTVAYEDSLNAALASNDAVGDLTAQLTTIQEGVTRDIDKNQDIGGIIDKLATGVGLASKIAGLLIKP